MTTTAYEARSPLTDALSKSISEGARYVLIGDSNPQLRALAEIAWAAAGRVLLVSADFEECQADMIDIFKRGTSKAIGKNQDDADIVVASYASLGRRPQAHALADFSMILLGKRHPAYDRTASIIVAAAPEDTPVVEAMPDQLPRCIIAPDIVLRRTVDGVIDESWAPDHPRSMVG